MTKIKVVSLSIIAVLLLIAAVVYSTVPRSVPVANQTLIKNYIPWLDSNDYRLIKNYEQRLKGNNNTMRGTPEQILEKELAMQSAVEFQAVLCNKFRTVSTEHVALFSTVSTEEIPGNDAKLIYHSWNMKAHLMKAGVSEEVANGAINLMFNIAESGDESDMQALNTVQTILAGANLEPAPHRKDMEIMEPKYFR